jgi:hypothetical protein
MWLCCGSTNTLRELRNTVPRETMSAMLEYPMVEGSMTHLWRRPALSCGHMPGGGSYVHEDTDFDIILAS